MEIPERLTLNPVPHPVPQVHRAGFPLEHPYVERCWTSVIGPSSVLLLRRVSALWRQQAPVTVDLSELATSLGLGRGTARSSPIRHTLERVVRFKAAAWSGPGELDVFTEVPPLSPRQLARVPAWTARQHNELLTRHLAELAERASTPAVPSTALNMTARLDRLQHRPADLGLAR